MDKEMPVEATESELTELLHGLRLQYELREHHIRLVLRSRDLEYQMCDHRCREEKVRGDEFAIKNAELQGKLQANQKAEQEIRRQNESYINRFKQVEDALTQSNDLFMNFRQDQDVVNKKLRRLEKENVQWRTKSDMLHQKVLEMSKEHTRLRDQLAQSEKKRGKVEELCRALRKQQQQQDVANKAGEGEISATPSPQVRPDQDATLKVPPLPTKN